MFGTRRAATEIAAALALGVPLAIVAAASTAHAQDLMSLEPGAKIENAVRMGDKQVPLPGGKWEVVFTLSDRRNWGEVGSAFLVRKTEGAAAAFLVVRTNIEGGPGSGWPRQRLCDRNNVHHNGSDNYYNREDADCWIVNHVVFTNRESKFDFYNRVKAWARKHGATATTVGNVFWRNGSYDYLFVSHFVDPAAYGFPRETRTSWVNSRWHANSVADGTPERRFIDAVKAFGETYRAALRKGFRGRLDNGVPQPKFDFQR